MIDIKKCLLKLLKKSYFQDKNDFIIEMSELRKWIKS